MPREEGMDTKTEKLGRTRVTMKAERHRHQHLRARGCQELGEAQRSPPYKIPRDPALCRSPELELQGNVLLWF